eukprot:360124-Chlamydomonas_euryale.AAC.3
MPKRRAKLRPTLEEDLAARSKVISVEYISPGWAEQFEALDCSPHGHEGGRDNLPSFISSGALAITSGGLREGQALTTTLPIASLDTDAGPSKPRASANLEYDLPDDTFGECSDAASDGGAGFSDDHANSLMDLAAEQLGLDMEAEMETEQNYDPMRVDLSDDDADGGFGARSDRAAGHTIHCALGEAELQAWAAKEGHTPLVFVSEDAREAHFMFACPDANRSRVVRYGFVGLRYAKFSDGEHLVAWCKNCPCGCEADRLCMEGQDVPHASYASFFGGVSHTCPAAAALIRACESTHGCVRDLLDIHVLRQAPHPGKGGTTAAKDGVDDTSPEDTIDLEDTADGATMHERVIHVGQVCGGAVHGQLCFVGCAALSAARQPFIHL